MKCVYKHLYSAWYPDTRMLSGSRFAALLDLGDSESGSEETCCICMERMSCVSVGPCGHSAFCFPCIFEVRDQRKPCPLCRGPIENFNTGMNCSLKSVSEVMDGTDIRVCELESLETVGDLADFYDRTINNLLDYFFERYCLMKLGRMDFIAFQEEFDRWALENMDSDDDIAEINFPRNDE